METLESNEEQGQKKPRVRPSWAKVLMRPQTFKTLVTLGIVVERVLHMILQIIEVFRE